MAGPSGKAQATPGLRIDKWLWQARFFRSRVMAAEFVAEGRLRLNGQPIAKPGRAVTPGDTLTFPLGNRIRLIRVTALGTRRGPASEAMGLYLDLDPPPPAPGAAPDPLE
ncbi:MAG: RNA-binding S4 domain-containing protein [Paracoccaceae bacterium]